MKSQKVLSQALVITNLLLGRYQKLLNGQVYSLSKCEYLTDLSVCVRFAPPSPSRYVCAFYISYRIDDLFAALHLIESFRISYFRKFLRSKFGKYGKYKYLEQRLTTVRIHLYLSRPIPFMFVLNINHPVFAQHFHFTF